MQSGRVAPVDNSRKEERRRGGEEKGEKEGKKEEKEGKKEEKEGKKEEKKRSPLTMGSRDFGPLTS